MWCYRLRTNTFNEESSGTYSGKFLFSNSNISTNNCPLSVMLGLFFPISKELSLETNMYHICSCSLTKVCLSNSRVYWEANRHHYYKSWLSSLILTIMFWFLFHHYYDNKYDQLGRLAHLGHRHICLQVYPNSFITVSKFHMSTNL